jgi:hypothetical protein
MALPPTSNNFCLLLVLIAFFFSFSSSCSWSCVLLEAATAAVCRLVSQHTTRFTPVSFQAAATQVEPAADKRASERKKERKKGAAF